MAAFLLVIVFSIQNREEVTVRFGFFPLWNKQWVLSEAPLFLVILCSLFLGVLIGGIGDFYRELRLKRVLGQHQRTVERLEKEIQSLHQHHTAPPSLLREKTFLEIH